MLVHDWSKIKNLLQHAECILLTTHINPDGDGLGAEAALYYGLRKLNKKVAIWNYSALPPEYHFLNQDNIYSTTKPSTLEQFDLIVIVDAGGFGRLGPLGLELQALNIPMICIDHHPNGGEEAVAKVIDEEVAATVCLIHELLLELNNQIIDAQIGEALFVGLLTDTGSFRFNNTSPAAFRLAAQLMEYGVKPSKIYGYVYENYSPQRMRLLGWVLQHINFEFDDRLAWFKITQEQIQAAGASPEDVDGFTEFVRSVRGVEIAVMFLEVRAKRTRLNFRSRGQLNVNGVARYFGGGGHPHAAGVVLDLTLEEAIEKVLPAVRRLFQKEE